MLRSWSICGLCWLNYADHYFLSVFLATLGSVQGLLWVLCSGITPDAQVPIFSTGTEPGWPCARQVPFQLAVNFMWVPCHLNSLSSDLFYGSLCTSLTPVWWDLAGIEYSSSEKCLQFPPPQSVPHWLPDFLQPVFAGVSSHDMFQAPLFKTLFCLYMHLSVLFFIFQQTFLLLTFFIEQLIIFSSISLSLEYVMPVIRFIFLFWKAMYLSLTFYYYYLGELKQHPLLRGRSLWCLGDYECWILNQAFHMQSLWSSSLSHLPAPITNFFLGIIGKHNEINTACL